MVFIPVKDLNPRRWIRYQVVTLMLVVACILVFLWQIGLAESEATRAAFGLGVVPASLLGKAALPPEIALVPPALTLATSLFLHGDLLHLAGNMLFLWVFGDNVEDAMGHRRFLAFFLICGAAGGLAHALSDPGSTVPLVGASGAISGVLGAYFILHPRVRVWVLLLSTIPMKLPTWVVLGGWIGFNALNAVLADAESTGVGWWAHVGGFAAGALLILVFRRPGVKLWDRSNAGRTAPSPRRKGHAR